MRKLAFILLLAVPGVHAAQDGAPASAPWLSAPSGGGASPSDRPAWAGAAAATPSPAAAPWLAGVTGGGAASTAKPKLELELKWSWRRLASDLEQIGRIRAGLETELHELRRQRGRFSVRDPRTGDMLIDHQAALLSAWRRVADRLLALDSIIRRYSVFEELQDDELRAGAFLAAYSAFAAQTRFSRDWLLAAGDEAMAKVQDAELPELGLKAGQFTALRAGVLAARDEALSQGRAYATAGRGAAGSDFRMDGARGLLKTGKAAAFALAGLKADTKSVKLPRRRGSVVDIPVFEPWLKPLNAASTWTGDELEAHKPAEEPKEVPAWASPSLASLSPFAQPWTVYAATAAPAEVEEESAFHLIVRMLVEPSTAARPTALIARDQFASFAERLEPGDILLFRREGYLEEPGLPAWWTGAGIYLGTPAERERLTGSTDLDGELNSAAPEAYWESLKSEEGDPRRIVVASPAGISVRSLERGGAGDALAALRPRLPLKARTRAALRALQAVGRPYDAAYDAADPSALYSAELVLWAYGETPLRLEPRDASQSGPPEPDDLARTFDSEFGTPRVSLDVVRFLDGVEEDGRAVRREPEVFRLTWKRPRWRFEKVALAETPQTASERK